MKLKVVSVKKYREPDLPAAAKLGQYYQSCKRKGGTALLVMLLASFGLFTGCKQTPPSQDVQDVEDTSNNDNQRLMGKIAPPKPDPQPMPLPGEMVAPTPDDASQQTTPEGE